MLCTVMYVCAYDLLLPILHFKACQTENIYKSHFETEFSKPRNGKSYILKRNPRGSNVCLCTFICDYHHIVRVLCVITLGSRAVSS